MLKMGFGGTGYGIRKIGVITVLLVPRVVFLSFFFLFQPVSWQLGERGKTRGEDLGSAGRFRATVMILQYTDIAQHCARWGLDGGRKMADQTDQARGDGRRLFFSKPFIYFVPCSLPPSK